MSVFFHLFLNGGNPEGLFRAGIMSSGSSTPTGNISELQSTYDFVVDQVGCPNATDTLACLRTVPADSLLAAANHTPAVTDFTVRDDVYRCIRGLRKLMPASLGFGDSVFPSSRWRLYHRTPSAARCSWQSCQRTRHNRYVS